VQQITHAFTGNDMGGLSHGETYVLEIEHDNGETIVLGGVHCFGRSLASAAGTATPTVDQLVMTNVVDNFYDVFAKRGKIGAVTVQRTALQLPMPLSEHGLAYHLASVHGEEWKEILLDFAWTGQSLTHNYQVLNVDPTKADALIISHGHADDYGALPDLARALHGRRPSGLTLYAGGEDTFCHRWIVTPDGHQNDSGQLKRTELEAQGIKVALTKAPTVVAGHAFTSGQIRKATGIDKVHAVVSGWHLAPSPEVQQAGPPPLSPGAPNPCEVPSCQGTNAP
jgi:metal-dependent hydrolase (beta-lactamase superfamily II)